MKRKQRIGFGMSRKQVVYQNGVPVQMEEYHVPFQIYETKPFKKRKTSKSSRRRIRRS